MVAHATMAAFTRIRELELDEAEARKYSEAIKEVAKHYSIGLSEKWIAWFNLSCVSAGIYGPRIVAYNIRRGAERRAAARGLGAEGVGPTPAPATAAAPPPDVKPNGHAAGLDLTPAFLTAPPVNEDVP